MSPLLTEFRDALPYVSRLPVLEAHLLRHGWAARSKQLPPPLEAYLDLVPLMLRKDTKLRSIGTLVKTTRDGDLWVLVQHLSIRTAHQAMVAFYDFGATVPIDPDLVSSVIGSAPKSVRRKGDAIAEASWAQPGGPDAPPALMINLAFSPAEERMPGARIIASAQVMGAADETRASGP